MESAGRLAPRAGAARFLLEHKRNGHGVKSSHNARKTIMSSFILRKIDPDLWQRVKTRATGEQLPLRQLLLLLLRGYADGEIHISARRE
jgi:hypothetical protein